MYLCIKALRDFLFSPDPTDYYGDLKGTIAVLAFNAALVALAVYALGVLA